MFSSAPIFFNVSVSNLIMKTKFLAGLVASLICLIIVVGAAILMTTYLSSETSDRVVKIVAFGAIAIWLGLYSWFKPKAKVENQNQVNQTGHGQQTSQEIVQSEEDRNRNSYN